MPSDRLTVGFAYQRCWQVVDNQAVIETFDTKKGAFQYLVDQDARVWLQWGRTVIGGKAVPHDFAAQFQQDGAGRIMKTLHGPSAGTWFWTCSVGGARGTVATKDEAAFAVERAYTRAIARADWAH